MCGRYTLIPITKLADRFDVPEAEFDKIAGALRPRYNVSPGQIMPTITEDTAGRHIELMQWGYLAPWAKTERDIFKYSTFNARSEGIFDKPMWKRAAHERRCLVPSSGFYEWRPTESGKQPYFIHTERSALFAFAGLYRYWRDGAGSERGTYTIVTTRANRAIAPIHDRMPVILARESEQAWLDASSPPVVLQALLAPSGSDLDIYPVSQAVNASRVDEQTLVSPLNNT